MTPIREQFYKRRIAELLEDSSNSSKPPSSDTVRPPNPKQSGASRRHGGQPGHKGNNNIRWLKHLIFHSTAIILLSLCTERIAIAQQSIARVSPSEGNTSTDFYWYVHYYDADGDPPSIRDVYIDIDGMSYGTSYEMRLDSGSDSNGTYIYGPMNLGVGDHNYFFYFTDGNGGSDRWPSSGTDPGPSVVDDDVKPTVSIEAVDSYAVELPSGAGYPSNDGVFRVTRTGSTTSQMVVYYNVGGFATLNTDYIRIPEPVGGNFVAIPPGASYADISVQPVDDSIVEGSESIAFTLESDAVYAVYTVGSPSRAKVTIFDDEDLVCDFCGANTNQPDGYVDYWDQLYFARRWHTSPGNPFWDPRCDVAEEDNYVDYLDLLIFAQQWHKGVKP